MRVTGQMPPDIAEQMGKCEVCGEQAVSLVQDFFFIEKLGRPQDNVQIEKAKFHRFCAAHDREPEEIRIVDDLILYRPDAVR